MDSYFNRLESVLFLEEPKDRIPFYDLFADPEVIEALTGKNLVVAKNLDLAKRTLKDSDLCERLYRDVEIITSFYFKLGYDYVPLTLPSPFTRFNIKVTGDTASLSRGERVWQDEGRGTIESKEDFEVYHWPDLSEVQDVYMIIYEAFKRTLPKTMMLIPLTPGGVLENVMWLMGAVPFFRALYKDPTLIRDMFDKIGKMISFICRLMAEQSATGAMSMGDDMGYKSGPMMSPQYLRKYVFPWHRMCVNYVHKYGKPFILHSCGKIDVVMEDLIEYVGIDAKHSYEDESYPVTRYKKLYGDRIAILGGVDMDKLTRMPLYLFREYVKNLIAECAYGGGYALGCGNSIANYIRMENFLAMLEVGRRYGKVSY